MKKFFTVLIGASILGFGGIVLSLDSFAQSAGQSADTQSAPAPSQAELAGEADVQTLFQEDAPSKSTDSAAGEAKPAPAPSAQEEPPSLSDYLNKAASKVGASGEATPEALSTGAAGVNTSSPGLNLPAGGAAADEPVESPEMLKAKAEMDLRKDAFNTTTNQLMPLKPAEIRRILELYDETTQAAETSIYPMPEPESAFQATSLDPGAKPLVIKTAVGNVTTLSIVDITGQPWPIQDLTWAGDFQIEQPDKGSHMLRITPNSKFATGNVSMRLLGLNPPVIFTLSTERKSVHVRLDVQVPEIGPNGVLPPVETPVSTKAGDDFMTAVLMGVTKGTGVAALNVEGIDGRTSAVIKDGMMYIRTPYTMLSPAWVQSIQSGDGTKVYALNFTPVILLSDKGKMVRAYLSHKEIADEQY